MAVNLLDLEFYRIANPDLAGFDNPQLLEHFQNFGLQEGRLFSPLVDLNYYRANNSDLSLFSQEDLFNHLANAGVKEGRKFSPFVDLNFTRLVNGDLANLDNEQLLQNLQDFGVREGRQFSPFVDLSFYRLANPDLGNLDNLSLHTHLIKFGIFEGRQISPFVDLGYYLNNNQDLLVFQGNQRLALEHLQFAGLSEGRRFSPLVDLNFYQIANPQLIPLNLPNQDLLYRVETQAINQTERFSIAYETSFYRKNSPDLQNLSNQDLLEHFQAFGLNEGRASSDAFNVGVYLANSPDLVAAGLSNRQALEHFSTRGFQESRLASTAAFFAVQDPPDTIAQATNLGVINNRLGSPLSQQLSNGDRDDTYRFTIASTNRVTVNLNTFSGVAQAQLFYDRNLNLLIESDEIIEVGSLGNAVSLSQDLAPGTYYVNVSTLRTDAVVNYNLQLLANSLPLTQSQDPGETLETALTLSDLSSGRSLQDFIGITDPVDIYRLNLAVNSQVEISIDGLIGSDTIAAQLIFDNNSNGQVETEFISSDTSGSSIFLGKNLGAGTYYVRIEPSNITQGTAYNLRLISTPLAMPNPEIDPGNDLGNAFDLGFLANDVTLTQFVGTADRQDVYRFIVSTGLEPSQNLQFVVDNLTDSVVAQLVFDRNGNNRLDSSDTVTTLGRSTASILANQILTNGNHFVLISSSDFQSNTNYRLLINR